ncbi:hypothetical protein BCR41DRAFT_20981 [Lobosporangium transversale]|uniref:Uncharacterized protein n=1 Tax=Lobosporangium transversale TaxID=64571 RepID=A0A1Y2GSK6_9FUNG|nr:hypothetical protein BCR41DRAFT_20981 [Lobosporangium transversale]ORZ21793.1 hypothetical protein BCR41DRAFT_20981 [Lobosporangium transversale]|eukprot:XP_021883044.1 hypothetical protein BCR41DRAFT_20981 [Lobosporangium transversale]
MLCLQWGFYFNASDKDLGSDDLSYLATSILVKTRDGLGRKHNTDFARNMTLLLFLSRLMILNYCLSIPGCERTFSSSRWAILQVCPTMFEDVFMSLFKILFGRLQERTISELSLTAVVSEELLSVWSHLASLSYPNFTKKSKLRLVVDEAQILDDQGYSLFESSYLESELRPLLSPVLHGFRRPGDLLRHRTEHQNSPLGTVFRRWCERRGVNDISLFRIPWVGQSNISSVIY